MKSTENFQFSDDFIVIRSESIRLILKAKFEDDHLVISSLRIAVIFEGLKLQIKRYHEVNSLLI